LRPFSSGYFLCASKCGMRTTRLDVTNLTMRAWFDALVEWGPMYGYFPKPSRCILLAKPDRVDIARKIFSGSDIDIQTEGAKDSGVEIISNGTRHLGAAVGT